MQNVEYKVELKDLPLARSIVRALGAKPHGVLIQTDTYYRTAPAPKRSKRFPVSETRLKKRETSGAPTEWISYEREDGTSPKVSRFKIYTEQEAAAKFGPGPHEIKLVVKKSRELYMLDHIRIHLDTVEGLGTFLEFEAMVSPRQNEASCRESVGRLRRELAPVLGEAIGVGYADLLEGQ
jgi:adenylate cyclase class 2